MSDARWTTVALVALALVLLPLAPLSGAAQNFLASALVITVAAQGWNLLAGYGGQFSFGHAAFFGTGAYTSALLQLRAGLPAPAAALLAVALAALAGFVIGFLSFRAQLRGSYFALVTLAFAEVFRIGANAAPFTGGAAGVLLPLRRDPLALQFTDPRGLAWLAGGCVILALGITAGVARSRFGAQLAAVRENEDAARALGVNPVAIKLKAITLSAGITGAAGCLYLQKFLYLDANLAFGPWISVDALLGPIIGGLGTPFGPILGTFALLGLGEVTKSVFAMIGGGAVPGVDLIVFGALLVLAIAFAPRGIAGLLPRRSARA